MIISKWNCISKGLRSSYKSNYTFRVAVILSYFEGKMYINEQIESILNQSIEDIFLSIYISDDNSQKDFFDINKINLDNLINAEIFYRKLNTNVGFAKNFLSSLISIKENYDFYAFCDQDDIWLKNKIAKAINVINKLDNNIPGLYCGRTIIYDNISKKDTVISKDFKKAPSFENALIQNIAGGNTMLFNKSGKEILVKFSENINIIAHDWWTYLIISGVGGYVYYDKVPYVKYRQHQKNLIGSNNGFLAKFKRILDLLNNRLIIWNDLHILALQKNKNLLSIKSQKTLYYFIKVKEKNIIKKYFFFYLSNIHRQTFLGNLGLYIALVFNKI